MTTRITPFISDSPASKLHGRAYAFANATGVDEAAFYALLHAGLLRSDAEITAFDSMEKGWAATCLYTPEYDIGVSTSGPREIS